MPDIPTTFLMEQQQVLREIRDELRATRAEGGGSPQAGPGGVAGLRPNSAFHRAQMQADRMLSQEWNTLGWSNAYRSQIKTTLPQDLLAGFGVSAPPSSMSFGEFEQWSRESLSLRGQTFLGGLVAPKWMAKTNAMADDIFQFSPRFIRAGNPAAGMLGVGTDRSVATQLSRQIGIMAAGDMRMSHSDYQAVMSTGLRTGQFDQAGSMHGLMQEFTTLKDVIADLSRTTRMTVQELATSMGALRQFGVTDVADQRRMIERIDATAKIAGLSAGELAPVVTGAIARGQALGIGANASTGLITTQIAIARNLQQSGILSGQVLAMGGGAMGIATSIANAQQDFLGSDMGYWAMRGGLGGGNDLFSSLNRGLGQAGGMQGFFAGESDRLNRLSRMSPAEAQAAYRSGLESQIRMFGVQDMTSSEAQNTAFMLLRGSMGAPAAQAFAATNFSADGRAMAARQQWQTAQYETARQEANMNSRAEEYLGPTSTLRRLFAAGRRGVAMGTDWMASLADPGMGGTWGRLESQAALTGSGSIQQRAAAGDLGAALLGQDSADLQLQLFSRQDPMAGVGAAKTGTVIGGLAGVGLGIWGGAKLGASIGVFAGGPLGAILGAGIGMGVGALAGSGIGGMFSDSSPTTYTSRVSVDTYRQMMNGMMAGTPSKRAADIVAGQVTQQGSTIFADTTFQSLMQNMSRGEVSDDFMLQVAEVAKNTGESVATVTQVLKQSGMDFSLPVGGVAVKNQNDLFKGQMEKIISKGGDTLEEMKEFNFFIGENVEAMTDFLTAGGGEEGAKKSFEASRRLAKAGMSGKQMEALRSSYGSMTSQEQSLFIESAGIQRRLAGTQAAQQVSKGVHAYARQLVGRESGMRRSSAEAALDKMSESGDYRQIISMFQDQGGDTESLRDILQQGSPIFGDINTLLKMDNTELSRLGQTGLMSAFKSFTASDTGDIQQILAASKGDAGALRNRLLEKLAKSETVETAAGTADEQRVEVLMNQTAQILKKLADDLKVTSTVKAA
ncbi:MAG TPA: hypothetical protein VLH09_09570 [Bryobacteraceae bacterium]|nr:hypothetical protein [Bryobacteraceae bacterium]